jgi:hypothetical protein
MGAAMSVIKANPDMVKAGAINPIKMQPEIRILTEEEQKRNEDEQKRKAELQKKLGM